MNGNASMVVARSHGLLRAAVLRWLAVALAVFAVLLLVVEGAEAVPTARGVDYASSNALAVGGAKETPVQVVELAGTRGETVFMTVQDGDAVIAKNLSYTLGQDDGQDQGDAWQGVMAVDIDGFDAGKLQSGAYSVAVFADRSNETQLYTGAIYGVYADVDADGKGDALIGTRTIGDSESGRSYTPPEKLLIGGESFAISSTDAGAGPALVYPYHAADAPTEGVVRYVYYDDAGESHVLKTEAYELDEGASQDVPIEDILTDSAGGRYRSMVSQESVVLRNPEMLSFTVYCAQLPRDEALDYVATIRMESEGELIARDQVDVRGAYTYTAPAAIYRTEMVDGVSAVVTYVLEDAPVVDLTNRPDGDVFVVRYTRQDPEPADVEVTFNWIDGTKEPGTAGRVLGTQNAMVSAADQNAQPDATIHAQGKTYVIAGKPADYAYEYRSGAMPVVDVYYTPEGYTPDGPYEVTVRCVNYANNKVVQTLKFTSSPSDAGAIELDVDNRFQAEGTTYIKLAGQADLLHSYYSGNRVYTVYYRDADDSLNASVGRVRVVYDQARAGQASAAASNSGASGSSSAGSADASNAQMNQDSAYAAINGESGDGTLVNERGQDAKAERIAEDETPLAAGTTEPQDAAGQEPAEADSAPGVGAVAAVIAALVAAVGFILFAARKRSGAEDAEVRS